jgi:serine/threonine protein kinase
MAAAGDRVDRFTLVRQLGAGGMGETWEAVRQTGHDFEQRVAIKLADQDVLDRTDGLASFRREAALSASLRHPNIAAVLDVDERGGYIVCELVDGADLRCVLRAAPGGRLDPPVLVHIMAQIARGLSHAHRRILRGQLSPVIHRDMSPGNVVIDYDGNVKIVDFGIAKATAVAGPEVAEAINGKLSYMAPEQAMGTRLDGRADQYALGVIAYEALTGVRPNDGPHEGATLACLLAGTHVPIASRAPSLEPRLAAIVERMLALHPDQRFNSLEELLDALVPLTPPFTVHRELIPLVMHARQPHTIVCVNGQFVSRPVDAVTPSEVARALRARSEAPSAPLPVVRLGNEVQAAALAADRPQRSPLSRLMEVRREVRGGHSQVAVLAPPASVASRGAPPASVASRAAPRARALSRSSAGRMRAWLDHLLASRGFWQALTGLGALLLCFVAWVALSPNALRSLGLVAPAGSIHEANLADPAGPALHDPKSREHAALVRVKVSVSPAGRVWIDQQLRAAVPPLLEVTLPPGRHVISAGRELPLQSRVVELGPGSNELVAFQLEGP